VTSFVGRRAELREVKRLLTTTRLLTLTGSGGVGKTKLAVRATGEMARGFPDGVWLVLLGSIGDPLLVTQAVFGALGVRDLSAGVSLSSLTDYLAGKRLLLVLDNCEHLLDGCAVLASTLLAACPDVHVLATSRQALGVAGEVRMVVPPMSLPDRADEATVNEVLRSDAVWLLAERAAVVVPGFAVDSGNAGAALRLCRRLDGIALALELAAVRLGSLTLDQLNEGLAGELSILGSGNRGAEARQQTLEATIGWSYGLLGEQEQLLWVRLSVFSGGFSPDAAAEVCCDARLPAGQIAGLLGALVEKSILKRLLREGSPPRYILLETMRQYGLERLREAGEQAAMEKRHFDWICELARRTGAWDGQQAELFRLMWDDQDNLWAALDFCSRHPAEIAAGAELAQHLYAFWAARGSVGDVRRVLAGLAEAAPEDSVPRARLLWVASSLAISQNDHHAAAELAAESLRIGMLRKDVDSVGWSRVYLAISRWFAGDLAEAITHTESALSLATVMDLPQVELGALNLLAYMSLAEGELDRAVEFGDRGLEQSRARGELWARGKLLNIMAQASWQQGERQRAQVLAQESASCSHALDDRIGLVIVLETLAWMAAEQGEPERAAVILGFGLQVQEANALPLPEPFRPQHGRSAAVAAKGLGKARFDAAFSRGQAMTMDDGVAFAVAGQQVPKSAPRARPEPGVPRAPLTGRQLEIARLIADDLTNRQIAERLFLSERTVETHITNMLNKLGLNSASSSAAGWPNSRRGRPSPEASRRGSGPGAQRGRVLLPGSADHEWEQQPQRRRHALHHEGAVRLVERLEHHPRRYRPLVPGDRAHPALAHGVPLLLRERHRGERDDLLLLVVEVRLDDLVQVVERRRQRLARLRRRPLAPGRARGHRCVQGRRDDLVLVLHVLRHRSLLRHPLDEQRVQQLVLILVVLVQAAEDQIDVIGQERDPPGRRRRGGADQPRGFVVRLAEHPVDDRHVAYLDRL
jgi:predicted ATPase/DNA-binding CsgD family transcriptional regulator